MSINENLTTFAGRPVKDFEPEKPIANPAKHAYRITISYEESDDGVAWTEKFAALLEDPKAGEVEALVVGAWGEVGGGTGSQEIVEAIAAARDRLGGLKHLFLGDITMEESEISWINQSDLSPLLEAYPNLEHLTVRGGQELSLGSPRHAKLRELIIQAGGLPPSVVHEVAGADLPALEHLELWLGEPNYGGDATPEDLAPLLRGERFPKLKYLGLKNSEIQDDIAAMVVLAPVMERLEVLDLSMGTLSDEGAKALLASPAVKRLKKLDIHHHFVSKDVVAALQGLGIDVDASEAQESEEWGGEQHRFIAVGE